MKLSRRPIVGIFLTSLILILNSIINPYSASAEELKATDITVSWDGNSFFEPPAAGTGQCTSYTFSYTMTNRVLLAYIYIKNQYGDKLGNALISPVTSALSGKASAQLCPGKDLNGSKIELEVLGRAGGPNEVISRPITFKPRTSPSVAPTPTASVKANPTPVPTVTVTAVPAPGPTVYVTNPADANLQDLVSSLKIQISSLEKKLKKVCAAKPKPRGC